MFCFAPVLYYVVAINQINSNHGFHEREALEYRGIAYFRVAVVVSLFQALSWSAGVSLSFKVGGFSW